MTDKDVDAAASAWAEKCTVDPKFLAIRKQAFIAGVTWVKSKPKDYVWAPDADITTYELALCTPAFFRSLDSAEVAKIVEGLPPEAKRHFKESGA